MSSATRAQHRMREDVPLLIYPDKAKIFGLMLLGLAYVALGVVEVLIPDPTPKYLSAVTQFAGVCFIVVMGIGTIGCLAPLFSSALGLIVNHEGVFINSTIRRSLQSILLSGRNC